MKIVFILFSFLLLFKNIYANNTEDYIARYKKVAIKEMKKYHIPASITLAQGILESSSGESRLARKGKNHFGIKCSTDWHGKTIKEDDENKNECFRKYKKVELSFRDHSTFIASRDRYQFLFELESTDYKAWAIGLKKAGYATNEKYSELLISIIEKYNLNNYDRKEGKSKTNKANFQKFHLVKKGDTLYSISVKYKITVEEIKIRNKKSTNDVKIGEKLILN